jgi:hypothetical protein
MDAHGPVTPGGGADYPAVVDRLVAAGADVKAP